MTTSSIPFNPATMNPAAIVLPTNNNINNDNIWFNLLLLIILILIGYILIKRNNI